MFATHAECKKDERFGMSVPKLGRPHGCSHSNEKPEMLGTTAWTGQAKIESPAVVRDGDSTMGEALCRTWAVVAEALRQLRMDPEDVRQATILPSGNWHTHG